MEEVDISEKIFWPDMISIKGKNSGTKPKPVSKDDNEIPK